MFLTNSFGGGLSGRTGKNDARGIRRPLRCERGAVKRQLMFRASVRRPEATGLRRPFFAEHVKTPAVVHRARARSRDTGPACPPADDHGHPARTNEAAGVPIGYGQYASTPEAETENDARPGTAMGIPSTMRTGSPENSSRFSSKGRREQAGILDEEDVPGDMSERRYSDRECHQGPWRDRRRAMPMRMAAARTPDA